MKHISSKELLQFCEGMLDPAAAARMEEHIASCEPCAAECEEIRVSISATRNLTPLKLSEEATERIKKRLRAGAPERKSRFSDPRVRAALAIAAAYVILTVVLQIRNPGARVHPVTGPVTEFEEVALSNYNRYVSGSLKVDLHTNSPQVARQWIRQQGNFSTPLAVNRPPEDGASFQLQGVKKIQYDGHSALLVTYRIDGHPVALLTALTESVSSAPRAGLLSKSISTRRTGHLNLLTWNSSGNVYTIVSDLPKSGRRACYICHTDIAHRKKIDAAF
jgi:hypothetical protein